jgi:hypothetical protein
MIRKIFSFALVASGALLSARTVHAQEEYSRAELGAQYSIIRENNINHQATSFSGVGGRFDWNFTRRLALESQADFFPQQGRPLPLTQGGQTLQAVVGIRAKVLQNRRISFFGLVRPGLLHFTDVEVPSGQKNPPYITQPATYFVLNLGGGVEYYPSPRWILRMDIEGNPYSVPAYVNNGFVQTGKINDTTRLSFGAAYRLGSLVENERESNVPGNAEVGPLFSTLTIAREGLVNNVRTEPGFGGYGSYRFYGPFYLDGDLLYFPSGTASSGPHDGGTILEGLLGVKGGIRHNRFGFFGKARPGFNSYSKALTSITNLNTTSLTYTYLRSTNFVLDLGGIVEFYPTERSTLRIEVGDTHIFFNTRDVNIGGILQTFPGGDLQHSIQLIVGYGWRF